MLRRCCLLGFIVLVLFSARLHASGDSGCGAPRGTIFFHGFDSCHSLPFLSPGNDTRLNLELLLIDAGKLTGNLTSPQDFSVLGEAWLLVPFAFENWEVHETAQRVSTDAGSGGSAIPSYYAQGEGSRCRNADAGLAAFKAAVVAAATLPKGEASILISARSALTPNCNATTHSGWKAPEVVRSVLGREFSAYIAGTSAFYDGDFPAALGSFNSVKMSADAWLRQTSRYMIGGRCSTAHSSMHLASGDNLI